MPETPVAPESPPVFNVDSLLKYMGSDSKGLAVVGKIVSDAFAGAGQSLEMACRAAREGRYVQAAREFHELRGTVGTAGTRRFVNAALAIEVAMLDQQGEKLDALIKQVESEFALARQQADAWLTGHGFAPLPA